MTACGRFVFVKRPDAGTRDAFLAIQSAFILAFYTPNFYLSTFTDDPLTFLMGQYKVTVGLSVAF